MGGWGLGVGAMASNAWGWTDGWTDGEEMMVVSGHWSWSWGMVPPWSLIWVHAGPRDFNARELVWELAGLTCSWVLAAHATQQSLPASPPLAAWVPNGFFIY